MYIAEQRVCVCVCMRERALCLRIVFPLLLLFPASHTKLFSLLLTSNQEHHEETFRLPHQNTKSALGCGAMDNVCTNVDNGVRVYFYFEAETGRVFFYTIILVPSIAALDSQSTGHFNENASTPQTTHVHPKFSNVGIWLGNFPPTI